MPAPGRAAMRPQDCELITMKRPPRLGPAPPARSPPPTAAAILFLPGIALGVCNSLKDGRDLRPGSREFALEGGNLGG